MAPEIKWTILDPPEKSRAYVFAGAANPLIFENVTKIEVQDSGKHRIETAGGVKAFVSPGWIALFIDTDSWTF